MIVKEPNNGYWQVDVSGPGYNNYRGYYPDGTLREKGKCYVDRTPHQIDLDRHDILDGDYYSPRGELISRVRDRTGTQKLCYPSGQLSWELRLENGKYAHVKQWHPNGVLSHEQSYVDGLPHGQSLSYYRNGSIRIHAEHTHGDRSGRWIYYDQDGNVTGSDDYRTRPDAELIGA